jgi:DNA-binding NarL/FixJ family response regulator
MTAPIRVLLVDDHDVVRAGVRALLEATTEMVVVAEASTAGQALIEARRTQPDVIVMDVRLADESGIEATRAIRDVMPAARILMLTSFDDDEALFASIMAGASGYVLKQIRGDDLVSGVREVARGRSLLDPAVTARVLQRLRKGKHITGDEKLERLSPQEERVLELIARGLTNREIGEQLGLAEKTVRNYVSNVLLKLEVTRRAEAAAYVSRHTRP